MAVGAGGVTTEVNLITAGFEEGVNKIVGLVGTINSALAKIGEIAIGASLGAAITRIISDLEKLPEAVVSSAAKMESSAAAMASAMEIAAKRSAEVWGQAGAEIDASVQKAQQGVDRAAREMANSLDTATQKAAEFAQQMERAAQTAQRGFTANNQQFARSVEDLSTRGGQAAEDLGTTLSRASQDYTRRISNIEAETSQRVGNIMGAFNDASSERTRVFNQSMGNIEFSLGQSTTRIGHSQRDLMEKFGDSIQSIRENTANRIASINESFAASSTRIGQQIEAENEKFTDGLELRQAAYTDSTNKLALQHEDTVENLTDSWEKLTRHSADAALKISRQVADQMAALRDAEEKAQREFARKMADLQEEELIGPKTQEEQNKLAKRRVQLGADLADSQQAIDKKKQQVAKQAQEEREQLQKQTQEAQQEIIKRQQKEQELYQRRLEFIDAQYARENLKAEENHQRTLAQLDARLAAEKKARDSAVAKAEAQGAAQEEAAKKQLARQLRAIEEQKQAEEQAAEHQRENLRSNYEAQQRIARNALERQLADAKANAERQREAAQVQYERQVEDANRAFDRITQHLATQSRRAAEDWETANDNIRRKWEETSESIRQAAANSARQSAIEYEKMGDRYNDAVAKMKTAIDTFNETHSNKSAQVAALFSEAWVKSFNEVQEAAGRAARAQFIDPADPDKFQKAAQQLTDIAKEMSVSMGKDANDVAKAMAALSLSNLDPLQNDLLQTTAAMSTLPQVTRGMTQVVNAFGALATGQIGEANQRFREFGVNLKDIPGLVFDANGKIETSEREAAATTQALAEAMKTSVEDIKTRFPDVSQQILQLVEITFRDRYKSVLENWLRTTEGQFAQAQAIYNNFKLDIGKAFNETIRGELTDFVSFLKSNQGTIAEIGQNIGIEMGKFAGFIIDGLKRLSQTDVVEAFTKLLNSLGNLKDQIVGTVQAIGIALAGGGVDFGGALAKGIENFAKLIDRAAQTIAATKFDEVAEKIRKGFFGAGDAAEEQGGKFEEALGTLMSALGTFVSFIVENGPEIITFFANLIDGATKVAKFVLEHGDEVKSFGTLLLGFGLGLDIAAKIEGFASALGKINFARIIADLGRLLGVLRTVASVLATVASAVAPVVVALGGTLISAIGRLVAALSPLKLVLVAVGALFTGAFVLKLTTGIDLLTPLLETFGGLIEETVKSLQLIAVLTNPFAAIFAIATGIPGVSSKIGEFANTIKEKILGLFPLDIDTSKLDLGEKVIEAIDKAKGLIIPAFDNLKKEIASKAKSLFDGIGTSVEGVKSTIGESDLWKGFTSQLDSAKNSAQLLGGEFVEFEGILARVAGKGLGALGGNIQKSLEGVQQTVEEASRDVGNAFDLIGTEISTSGAAAKMAELGDNWSKSLANIQQTTQDAATDLGTAFDLIGTEISTSGVAAAVATLGDNWNTSLENIKKTTQDAATDVGNAFNLIGTQISTSGLAAELAREGENLKTSWTNVQQTFQGIADSIPQILASAGEGIQSSLGQFSGFIAEWVGKIPGVLGGLQDILFQALVQPWINIYFEIKKALLAISGESLIDDWFADLAKNLPRWMTDAVLSLIEAVNTSFQELTNTISDSLDNLKNIISDGIKYAFNAFSTIADSIKTDLDNVTTAISEWATGLLDVLKTNLSPEKIGEIITNAFSGVKDKVMGFLHELHGSGEIEPWLDDLNKTLVEGLSKAVVDSTEAFSGIADAIGDELSAASEEMTTFVASLSEATNEVNKDMSNIIQTAKSGGASIDRFQGLKLAIDTGPAGGTGAGGGPGGGGGGGQTFEDISKKLDQQEAQMYGQGNNLARMQDATGKIGQTLDKLAAGTFDQQQAAQQEAVQSPAMQQANDRLTQAATNVAQAGKSLDETTKSSMDAQRQNFENLTKGISSGQAAWTEAAKGISTGTQAWSGAAQNTSQAAKDISSAVSTTGGGGPPSLGTPPPPPPGSIPGTNFAVNVSTINVENGEAIDFMQTYVDQYASLLNPGATL